MNDKKFVIIAHGYYSSVDGKINIPENISLLFAERDKNSFYVDKLNNLLSGEDWHRWYPGVGNVNNYTFCEFNDINFQSVQGIHEILITQSGTTHWQKVCGLEIYYPFKLGDIFSCLTEKYPNDSICLYVISCRVHI